MKAIIGYLALLIATTFLGASEPYEVTVRLAAEVHGTHTNAWFLCHLLISNRTGVPLTVTNLFSLAPGLALRIMDWEGKDLQRT